jgi:hypothetical protein
MLTQVLTQVTASQKLLVQAGNIILAGTTAQIVLLTVKIALM